MSQEDFPIEFVLEGIESIMASTKQPKVILFDIGGVCFVWQQQDALEWKYPSYMLEARVYPAIVLSPMQAILDFEISKGIPPGWKQAKWILVGGSCFPGAVKTSRASTSPIMNAIQYRQIQFQQPLESRQMKISEHILNSYTYNIRTTCFLHLSKPP
ncbi:epoxide hydrolase protein [Rutstroemia sp. NJR-2017a BVV2]|nr:epoxide hydrolase protein [Rutstroemia sp. NJR-2017a BVV2]